jgi:hypothetical protein
MPRDERMGNMRHHFKDKNSHLASRATTSRRGHALIERVKTTTCYLSLKVATANRAARESLRLEAWRVKR